MIYCQNYHEKSWLMPYLAVVSTVVFGQLEKANIQSQLYIAQKKKRKLYGTNELTQGQQDNNSTAYNKICLEIDHLNQKLIDICKITRNNRLYESLIENYPQAVVGVSICFASLENSRIRNWLIDGLISNIFPTEKWTWIALPIACLAILSLVSIILKSR